MGRRVQRKVYSGKHLISRVLTNPSDSNQVVLHYSYPLYELRPRADLQAGRNYLLRRYSLALAHLSTASPAHSSIFQTNMTPKEIKILHRNAIATNT
jgi:hypothetical protein